MAPKEFDVVVIGSGPGGYVAAIRCAQQGMKTAIVEKEALGGTCLNWGCIPTKALLKTAERYHAMRENAGGLFQINGLGFNWDAIVKHSRDTTVQMSKGVEFLMKKNKIEVFGGLGRYAAKDTIIVSDLNGNPTAELKAKNSVLATGAKPAALPGVEIDGKAVISSREAMVLPKLPETMAIIGAGAIGLEFAYFYAVMGTKVTLLEYAPHVMPAGDEEVCKELEKAFKRFIGVKPITGAAVKSASGKPGAVKVEYERGGKTESIEAEVALMAVGVRPLLDGLGLEEIGVETSRGGVVVNDRFESTVPGLYAIGDVIVGKPALAHAATAEAHVAAEAIGGKNPRPIDYTNVPACVYCQPQVASVGLTEKQARDAGEWDVHVEKFPFKANGKSVAINETFGYVKLIGDRKYGEILGAHVIGSEATELIAEIALARSNELTLHELCHTIHAHPTQAEVVMEAAANWLGESAHI